MRTSQNRPLYLVWLVAAILTLVLSACSISGGGGSSDTNAPEVASTTPTSNAQATRTNDPVTATFDEAMDTATLTSANFTVTGTGGTPVAGTVSHYDGGKTVVFTPASALAISTVYTATLSTGVEDAAGNSLSSSYAWSFSTDSVASTGLPVYLGSAEGFAILAKSGITTTGTTNIVGDVGISPAARSDITGFSETLDAGNEFATSTMVTGKIYAADMAPPTPTMMTTAIADMETAYTEAAGRTTPDTTDSGTAGSIGGLTISPGLHRWGTNVSINTDLTLNGGSSDVWVMQISGDLTVASVSVFLTGGALPENVFWQVAGQVTLGTSADFKGVILSKTQIAMDTGAALNGSAFAQTAVTLDANAVNEP